MPDQVGVGQPYFAVDRSLSPKPDEAGRYVDTLALRALSVVKTPSPLEIKRLRLRL